MNFSQLRITIFYWFGVLITRINTYQSNGIELNYPKVISGDRAEQGKFGYVVYIIFIDGSTTASCNGVIIDHHSVLTAAHCFSLLRHNDKIIVYGGDVDWKKATYISEVEKYTIHPEFHTVFGKYFLAKDIAFIQVHGGFRIERFIESRGSVFLQVKKRIVVNTRLTYIHFSRNINDPGTECQAVSWGKTNLQDEATTLLHYSNVSIIGHSECHDHYSLALIEHKLCAAREKTSVCVGDFGGPLVCNGFLIGIALYSLNCESPGVPVIFLNVKDYFMWIGEKRSDLYGSLRSGNGGKCLRDEGLFPLHCCILLLISKCLTVN